MHMTNVVHTPADIDEETRILEEMTPEELGKHIRELVLESRRARAHREGKRAIRKNDLRALAAWERELTNGYGVER